jgi:RNA polymerase-binding transcription factor DksA
MNAKKQEVTRVAMEKEIVQLLRQRYAQRVDERLPLSYYLDFKADVRLLELRDALRRMEQGTYGICLLCKSEIPDYILEDSLTALFCESCAAIALRRQTPGERYRKAQ